MDVGIIGVGKMGKNHLRVYSELRGVGDIYIYDIDKNTVEELSRIYDAIPCSNIRDLLKKVDTVSICTPTKYHFEIAKKVIEEGVNCLIEKPVTSTSKEGEELLKIIKDDDLIVGVGHIERFNPIVREIKKLIRNPIYIEIKRHNPSSSRVTDVNVVIDLMIHDIDVIWNYLFNIPENDDIKIYSIGNNDFRKVIFEFNGRNISLSASRVACKKIRQIIIEDEDVTIEGDFMTQEVFIYKKPEKYGEENFKYIQENIVEKVLINKVEPLREELKTFIKCVKNGKEFPVTVEQGVINLKIAEKIMRV
jgi:predicted dehydrogenase